MREQEQPQSSEQPRTTYPAHLVAFLNACWDEKQALANAATELFDDYGWTDTPLDVFLFAQDNDPAEVLADIAAKRKLLQLADAADEIHYDRFVEVGADLPPILIGERMRREFARPFSNRTGYDPAWAVSDS